MITSPPNHSKRPIRRWRRAVKASASLPCNGVRKVFYVSRRASNPMKVYPMKKFLYSRNGACRGAALILVLAFVVLGTALGLAYFSRTTTDRQLAQSSHNDTSADLLARSALDITVSDFKQEIANNPTVTTANIKPASYPSPIPADNPNLIRYSSRNDARSRASNVISTAPAANGRSVSLPRWNSHSLIPPTTTFTAPDWVLVTAQGPTPSPTPGDVIGRYAFAVYDEGGLLDMNLGGFPNYASLSRPTLPTRPGRRLPARYPLEESEIMHTVDDSLIELLIADRIGLMDAMAHARDPNFVKDEFQKALKSERKGWFAGRFKK